MPYLDGGYYWPPRWPQVLMLVMTFIVCPAGAALGYLLDDYHIAEVNISGFLFFFLLFWLLRRHKQELRRLYKNRGIYPPG